MLTDLQIRRAKPTERPYKLTDGAGLHLFITPAGGKIWRLRFRLGDREQTHSIGPYPEVGLTEAREARTRARALIRVGKNPNTEKRDLRARAGAKPVDTFEAIAREWHAQTKEHWVEVHAYDVLHSLERDIFPELGATPIRDIGPPEVLRVLRAIEARPAVETAHRVRQRVSAVFVFAIASGRADNDPAAIVQKALKRVRRGRQPAITELEPAREIIRRVDAENAYPETKLALRLLALTAVRPGTLITTPWAELSGLDGREPLWQIPAARMKLRLEYKDDDARDHIVPLSRQAVEAINALRSITSRCPLVFPNTRHPHRPMSENAIGYLLNRAGYHHRHVPHGWRSTFSTVMNERFPADRQIIDLMLAHVPDNRVEGAYNRAAHLGRRRELAQLWADLIMEGQVPAADLLPMRRHG
jgi:integrase